jgi:hypothetical protein
MIGRWHRLYRPSLAVSKKGKFVVGTKHGKGLPLTRRGQANPKSEIRKKSPRSLLAGYVRPFADECERQAWEKRGKRRKMSTPSRLTISVGADCARSTRWSLLRYLGAGRSSAYWLDQCTTIAIIVFVTTMSRATISREIPNPKSQTAAPHPNGARQIRNPQSPIVQELGGEPCKTSTT